MTTTITKLKFQIVYYTLGFTHWLKSEKPLKGIINSTTWLYCPKALIWMHIGHSIQLFHTSNYLKNVNFFAILLFPPCMYLQLVVCIYRLKHWCSDPSSVSTCIHIHACMKQNCQQFNMFQIISIVWKPPVYQRHYSHKAMFYATCLVKAEPFR